MSRTGAKILLTTVFIARGTSFLFSKILMESMSPMSILAIRFIREEEKRKIYQITDLGLEILQIELNRIERLYRIAHEQM